MSLTPEIKDKLRNLDPEDMRKISGFFELLEEGDSLAIKIWSMANNRDIEPRKVADLIYDYMGHRSKPQPEDESIEAPGRDFRFRSM